MGSNTRFGEMVNAFHLFPFFGLSVPWFFSLLVFTSCLFPLIAVNTILVDPSLSLPYYCAIVELVTLYLFRLPLLSGELPRILSSHRQQYN